MLGLEWITNIDSLQLTALEKEIEAAERIIRENFTFDSQYYSLIGWQKLICLNASNDLEATKNEIIAIADKALALDPHNEKAYLLLGALYSLIQDQENTKKVWEKIKLLYRL